MLVTGLSARRHGRRARRGCRPRRSAPEVAAPAPSRLEVPPGVDGAVGRWWLWRGFRIRVVSLGADPSSEKPPVVLVHGFGASADYFRRLLPALGAAGYRVHALDLLGLGLSEKPADCEYSIGIWSELVRDFCDDALPSEAPVLVGNSIGALVALTAAASDWGRQGRVRGLVLLNCAGGMNTKHMVTDDLTPWPSKWAARLVQGILEALLSRRQFAAWFFGRVRQPENVRAILRSIYTNKAAVDDELVQSILAPAQDPNALDVFVKILTGDPGTSPEKLMPRVTCPVRVIWGDSDTFTPLDGAYGQYFHNLAQERPGDVSFSVVAAGHCLHDDNPSEVHAALLPWLDTLNVGLKNRPLVESVVEEGQHLIAALA